MLSVLLQGPAPTQWGPVWYIVIILIPTVLGGAAALWRREANRADRLEAENRQLQQDARNRLEDAVTRLESAQRTAQAVRAVRVEQRAEHDRRRR